ncbi:MAG: hypothetical protein ACI4OZ_04660 [Akkermansia sp.]
MDEENMISTLLPKAKDDDLRAFVRELAGTDADFAGKLSQWLMSKYAAYTSKPSVYVKEVQRLFRLTNEEPRGRHYWETVLDFAAVESGMEQIVAALRQKLADGCYDIIPLPVVTFYSELADYLDDFMESEFADLDSAAQACDNLILDWAKCPDVPLQEKKSLYETLKTLSNAEVMEYVAGLTEGFFINYLTFIQTPEEALASIAKRAAEGRLPEDVVHRYIDLLRQLGRENEASEVIRRNLNYPSVMDAELDRLYEQQNDPAALELLDAASPLYRNRTDIEKRKIRFLTRSSNTQGLLNAYRYILLHSWDDYEYYTKLKELAGESEWPEQYRLITEEGAHSDNSELMAYIYAEEKDFPRLYQTLMKARYNILKLLHLHMPQMPEEYHKNLLQKAYKRIDSEAHEADKRPAYAHVASLIQEFASLPGAKPLAKEMVLCLRLAYMRRPAYMDELNKLKLDGDSSR